jgi:murein DD-endopeptidase MepM/ murein hydrolase activator NlpD
MKHLSHTKRRFAVAVVAMAAAVFSSACATNGIHHVVAPGENLYRIGKAYGVPYDDLARVNRIKAPYRLEIGDELYIHGANRQLPVGIITPSAVSSEPPPNATLPPQARPTGSPSAAYDPRGARLPAGVSSARSPAASAARVPVPMFSRDGRVAASGFSWPMSGNVSSSFGSRARGHHDGIDISAMRGAPVFASRDGKVIFADRLSGYGNVIIVEHSGGYTTVYAHNDANLVRKGTRVRRGERIATVGDTGRARGPHLHFEVRKGNVARNPLYYLPQATTVAAAR